MGSVRFGLGEKILRAVLGNQRFDRRCINTAATSSILSRIEYAAAREEREQRDDASKQSKYEAEMKKNEAELESIQKGGYAVNIILPNGMSPSSNKWMARQAKRSLTPKPEEHEGATEDTELGSDSEPDLSK